MSEEQSNLVDEVSTETPTTEETSNETAEAPGFDPKAFASDQPLEQFQGKYNEEAAEKFEETQNVSEESETDENGFAWDSIEVEQKEEEPEVIEEVDEDWDAPAKAESTEEVEVDKKEGELEWGRFAKELGLSA